MYPIRLITVGRPKTGPIRDLDQHYRTLLKAHARLDVDELPEGRGDAARQLKEEAERIRARLEGIRCPVLLCAEGPARTSEDFARWLGVRMDRGESLAFAIGSSHGLDPALKGEVREQLSLSPMTFPHDLSRVLFLEQLYRAFTILKGGPYHK
ncbi:23S rRNA (pseudouridine(1915)-N(3))-methyltransferase RlmH [Mesoterricola sediminis]|uniref:Ribosomal RNA large subunit methyltransferase H n=1 Tax=Mesoterricola sediminis TaxID=2927980 RepID=A0AA48KHC7_9BACT|nr:23S rRNA (pseudouridine(1915)-N(3))-methyltransferase RlmH [Mesoterricola sediminis]BDU78248.1 ribosomal RNA large subunit methyltransferase H [Mesoterricola sediminis]